MKTAIKNLIVSGLFVTTFLISGSCQKEKSNEENEQYASILNVSPDGTSSIIETNFKSALIETPVLTDAEIALLSKMKEEEKLAHDVYSVLYQKWENRIFLNISNAENNHLNAILFLMSKYNLPDTIIEAPGIFNDTVYQALYNEFIIKGSFSREEAFKTGALIEEMDIKDLKEALATLSNENLRLVFENLLRGTRNHLRAFNRQLTNLGIVYVPTYISQEEYNLIVNSQMENGPKYRMHNHAWNGQGNCTGGNGNGNNGNGNGNGNNGNGHGRP